MMVSGGGIDNRIGDINADAAPGAQRADNALIDFHRRIGRVDADRWLIRRRRLAGRS